MKAVQGIGLSNVQAVYDGHPSWAGNVQMWFMNPVGYDPDESDLVTYWHLPVLQDTVSDSAWTSWNALQGETYLVHPDGTLYWYDDYLTCPGDSSALSSQIELLVGP